MQSQTPSQTPKTSPQPRWQYLVIQIVTIRAFGNSNTNFASDNKDIEKALKDHKSVDSALSMLGSQGWELVTSTPGSAAASSHLYFKRRSA